MSDPAKLVGCLSDALSRVTERAAIAAWSMVGRGDEQAADLAAARAMKSALNGLAVRGHIIVGETEILDDYEAILASGESFGAEDGMEFDFALDALEGTTIAAKAKANALTVIAAAPRGGFLPVPDIYMEKLAIGPGHARDVVDLDAPAGENAERLARSKGVNVREITVCVLDRPRHQPIIADLRRVGARVNLIGDGDVAAVINTSMGTSGIDMYAGEGGAPMGILAAAALKCVGGQMQGRLVYRNNSDKLAAEAAGISDLERRYQVDDLVNSLAVFSATGVTKGSLLDGVRQEGDFYHTHSLIMRSETGEVRDLRSRIPESYIADLLNA